MLPFSSDRINLLDFQRYPYQSTIYTQIRAVGLLQQLQHRVPFILLSHLGLFIALLTTGELSILVFLSSLISLHFASG